MDPKAAGADTPLYYTNHIGVGMAVFGLSMQVGVKRQDDSVVNLCEIHMSPQHAKVLCGILQDHVKAYEAQVGPITLPEKGES